MTRRALAAAAALALVLLFWKLRLTDPPAEYQLGSADFYTQIYPMWARAAESMAAGRVPLWNPYQTSGHPFLASALYGVLYPPNLVRLALPVEIAFELNIVFHLWLGMVFAWLYGRMIGLGRPAAALLGVAYGFSGGAANEATWFTSTIAAMVWLPLGLAAIEGIFGRGGTARRWTAALAIAVAMPILAGWLQVWLYNAWALCAYAAAHCLARLRRERGAAIRGGALAAAGIALGVGLAAAQLLPSLELQQLGPRRPGGLSLEQVFPMSPLPPDFFLREAVDSAPGRPRLSYAGLAVLLLAPLALAVPGQRRRSAFLAAMAVASLLVALNVYTPAYGLSRFLPGGTWFRVPWRILCLYSFAMAALAAIAFDGVWRGAGRGSRWAALIPAALAAALLLLVDVPAPGAGWIAAAALLLGAAMLAAGTQLRRGAAVGLALIAGLELFVASRNPSLRPWHDPSLFDVAGEIYDHIAARQGFDRTFNADGWRALRPEWMHKQATLRGLWYVTDYEILSLARTARLYRGLAGRFAAVAVGNRPFSGDLVVDSIRLKQLGALGVRFVITGRDQPLARLLEQSGWSRTLAPPEHDPAVFENPRVLPRAYLAHEARVAPDEDTALNWMMRGVFDPFRFVVLEAGDGAPPAPLASSRPIAPADIVAYEPERVEIAARADAPAYLVLADTWYPGWRAEVDGRPAAIERANFVYRAVRLEPGEHRVVFTYAPLSWKAGVALSLLSAAALLVLSMGALRRRSVASVLPPRGSGGRSTSPHSQGGEGMTRPALEERVAHLEGRTNSFDARFDGIERQVGALDAKADATAVRLENKIDAVESRLQARIDAVESKLEARIDAVESKLEARIDGVESKLEAKVESVRGELQGSIAQLGARIDRLDHKFDRTFHWMIGINVMVWVSAVSLIGGLYLRP